MIKLFAALESIRNEISENEDFELLMLNMEEDENDIERDMDEYSEEEDMMERIELSIEHLNALKNVIEEHGICKAIVAAGDPTGELREMGVLPSIEELNDIPTKDTTSEVALEGVKEMLTKAKDAVVSFLKKIWELMKSIFTKIINFFSSTEKVLARSVAKLKDAKEFDAEKIKDLKISYFKNKVNPDEVKKAFVFVDEIVSNFNVLERLYVDLLKNFNAVDENIKKQNKQHVESFKKVSQVLKTFGIKVSFDNNTEDVKIEQDRSSGIFEIDKVEFNKVFSSPIEALKVAKDTSDVLVLKKKLQSINDTLAKSMNGILKSISQTKIDENESQARATKKVIEYLRKSVSLNQRVVSYVIMGLKTYVSVNVRAIAKAAAVAK